MHLYLYDSFLNDKKYTNLLARIETRLTDLGIGGKIYRLSPLRNLAELLADETRGGAQTVVVVGNDKTFSQVINVAAKYDVTMGLIPVGGENKIAQTLGLGNPFDACNTVAARIIEKVDLGKVNDTYFLTNIIVTGGRPMLECEGHYHLTPQTGDQVSICNLKPLFASNLGQINYFNPQDGYLEILVQPPRLGFWQSFNKSAVTQSIIPIKKLTIKGKNAISIITDGQKVLKPPVAVEVVPKKLKVIVGKGRLF